MILPPSDAIIPTANIPYKDYRNLQHQVVHEQNMNSTLIPAGCTSSASYGSSGSVRRLQTANTCSVSGTGAAGIMCWMKCVTVADLSCANTDAVCYDPTSMSIVDGGKSYMSAKPMCLKDVPKPASGSTGTKEYCQGTGTVMYMDGFAGIGTSTDGNTLCINYLFQTWTLDTKLKCAFACIGTLLVGILVQFISKARGFLSRGKWSSDPLRKFTLALLFLGQVTLGYFLMLLAMTYNVELFCMVCVGLTLGFVFFHLDEASSEVVDPCCADNTIIEKASSPAEL